MSITRREIRQAINSQERWYQNIRFGFMLETNFTLGGLVRSLVGLQGIDKNDVLLSNLSHLSGKRVIDIGCNAGLYSVEASCRGASFVLGVDKNPVAVEQARLVESLYRRMGRPVGTVEFRRVDNIQNELHLLDDKDVLIAPCVLYHLGPLDQFKKRLIQSRISVAVLQGNTARLSQEYNGPKFNNPRHPQYEPVNQTWGNVLSGVPGMHNFLQDMGFSVSRTMDSKSGYPVVVGVRDIGRSQ